jgi:hypothetical protein
VDVLDGHPELVVEAASRPSTTTPSGLLWISRQRDTSRALILFGDRVKVGELALAPGEVPLTLGAGEGLEAVCAAANPRRPHHLRPDHLRPHLTPLEASAGRSPPPRRGILGGPKPDADSTAWQACRWR